MALRRKGGCVSRLLKLVLLFLCFSGPHLVGVPWEPSVVLGIKLRSPASKANVLTPGASLQALKHILNRVQ